MVGEAEVEDMVRKVACAGIEKDAIGLKEGERCKVGGKRRATVTVARSMELLGRDGAA